MTNLTAAEVTGEPRFTRAEIGNGIDPLWLKLAPYRLPDPLVIST